MKPEEIAKNVTMSVFGVGSVSCNKGPSLPSAITDALKAYGERVRLETLDEALKAIETTVDHCECTRAIEALKGTK